jgi:excisionase family DNA binding protein
MSMNKFYTVQEAMKELHLSLSTVRRFIKEGKIPSVRIGGRVLIPVAYFDILEQRALEAMKGFDSKAMTPPDGEEP